MLLISKKKGISQTVPNASSSVCRSQLMFCVKISVGLGRSVYIHDPVGVCASTRPTNVSRPLARDVEILPNPQPTTVKPFIGRKNQFTAGPGRCLHWTGFTWLRQLYCYVDFWLLAVKMRVKPLGRLIIVG